MNSLQKIILQPMLRAPLQSVRESVLAEYGIELLVKRLDLINEDLSGNKAFKLRFNLQHARSQGIENLLSFGGPFSNHLHALAAAGHSYDFKTVGIIRGEKPVKLNATQEDLVRWGMVLRFVSREQFRRYRQVLLADNGGQKSDQAASELATVLEQEGIIEQGSRYFVIPEGGSNLLGALGCREITAEIEEETAGNFEQIVLACGTGATLAGMASSLSASKKILGVAVLKGATYLDDEVNRIIDSLQDDADSANSSQQKNWLLNHDFHFGGYAQFDKELIDFIDYFENVSGINIEPIYTGKLFFAIYTLAKQGYWPRGSRIIAVHTGGLQGLRGNSEKIKQLRFSQQSAQCGIGRV